jgi:hypothetical protein
MAAIVIMATGFGWVGGNFSTATDTLPAKSAITLGHLIFPGYALANPDPVAFGPHHFADYTAIVIWLAGAVIWLLHPVVSGAPRLRPRTAGEQPAGRRSSGVGVGGGSG